MAGDVSINRGPPRLIPCENNGFDDENIKPRSYT